MSLFSSIRSIWSAPSATSQRWAEPPFPDDRPSIYRALKARQDSAGGVLPLPHLNLPDNDRFEAAQDHEFTWAPGAMDGVFSHHVGADDGEGPVPKLLAALKDACDQPGQDTTLALHEAIPKQSVLAAIDPLLAKLGDSGVDPRSLHTVAHWIATESPDREPVKFGIALLGALRGWDDLDLFLTLGSHDEFTLFAAVAVANRDEDDEADRALWRMAQMTDGWGRIQAIERMSPEPAPEIAAWLLRDGYANSIMNEYLAHSCATKGQLLVRLKSPAPDAGLMIGAGEILAALINGGPAAWMADYDDGARAAQLYVAAAGMFPPDDLRRLKSLRTLRDFAADEERDWSVLDQLGWTPEVKRSISGAAEKLIAMPRWKEIVLRELEANEASRFGLAADTGSEFGIDVWECRLRRQSERREDQWWWLMQTDDRSRAEQVVALAEDQIDLAAVATGPGLQNGLGPGFEASSAVGFIVQDLGRFPCIGWRLIRAALMDAVIRNRNMALKALATWPRENWPAEAAPALAAAFDIEPDAEVRGRMAALRDGRPLPE